MPYVGRQSCLPRDVDSSTSPFLEIYIPIVCSHSIGEGEHCHHDSFEHQFLWFLGRTSYHRLAFRGYESSHRHQHRRLLRTLHRFHRRESEQKSEGYIDNFFFILPSGSLHLFANHHLCAFIYYNNLVQLCGLDG